MLKTIQLYDFSASLAGEDLKAYEYPWEALPFIGEIIARIGAKLSKDEYEERPNNVWIAKDAAVFSTAYIGKNCIIGHRTEVRHCAFLRENALVGDDCVVGNSVELKNAILFNGVQVPHFNYVGDSILGKLSHMGAGAVTSNVKIDKHNVVVKDREGNHIETGLFKFGAMLGDFVEVGCNSVLNPGTVIGRNCLVYPTSSVRGVIPENHIFKDQDHIVPKQI